MGNVNSWLTVTTARLRPKLVMHVVAGASERNAIAHAEDFDNLPSGLSPWHRSCTTIVAEDVHPNTGAAILPKAFIGDEGLARKPGWKQCLAKIAKDTSCRDWQFARDFLLDVEHWHHHSTNGRWNDALGRWERYAVRSVDDWLRSGINLADERRTAPPRVSKRTFHRLKDDLMRMGFIDASSHLWQGTTRLWIRPTEELSRLLWR